MFAYVRYTFEDCYPVMILWKFLPVIVSLYTLDLLASEPTAEILYVSDIQRKMSDVMLVCLA
jgi:hypothetical protein